MGLQRDQTKCDNKQALRWELLERVRLSVYLKSVCGCPRPLCSCDTSPVEELGCPHVRSHASANAL